MKKALFAIAIAAIIGLGSSILLARGGGPGRYNEPCYNCGYGQAKGGGFYGIGYLEFLKEEIGVTDEQIQKIIKIDSEYRAKFFDNRKDINKLDELRIEHRKEVEKVLTADQKKKLDEYNNKNWERRREFRPGPRR